MSCGGEHDKDCAEILARMEFFIDHELEDADVHEIQRHLDECGPCLADYGIERTVKALVARSCCDPAPRDLRERVLVRIREVHVQVTETRLDG
jgi:mycothiol system anti-sigma-R factor